MKSRSNFRSLRGAAGFRVIKGDCAPDSSAAKVKSIRGRRTTSDVAVTSSEALPKP